MMGRRAPSSEFRLQPSVATLVLECHHGSLGIARSLGRQGVHVHCVHADLEHPALKSRYFKGAHRWDLLGEPAEDTLSFLDHLGSQLGEGTLLIPTSDETAGFVADHAEVLSKRFAFARQSPELIARLTSKMSNYELAKSCGIPVPQTEFPRSVEDVRAFCEQASFPVVLKGIEGRRLFERTGCRMLFVKTPEELVAAYERMEDPESPNLMLQEYVPGGDDTIWIFNGYFDANSTCRCAFTGRKIRQTPPHRGATSLGICEANDTVERMTIKFMQDIGYTGILDIGYRYDARDGSYKLLDPNPRIGSTFRLFVGDNGMDVARYLYLDMTGQQLPKTRPRHGRKWFVEEADLESFSIYLDEGVLTPWEWLTSFRGVEEAAWFALDDLGPFAPHAWGIAKRVARRIARPLRSPPR